MSEEKSTIEENQENLNKDMSGDKNTEDKKDISPEEKIAELEDKFIINTDDILDPSQQAKLGTFKNKMMRDMRGKMKKKVGRNDKKRKWGRRNKDNKRKYWNN